MCVHTSRDIWDWQYYKHFHACADDFISEEPVSEQVKFRTTLRFWTAA